MLAQEARSALFLTHSSMANVGDELTHTLRLGIAPVSA